MVSRLLVLSSATVIVSSVALAGNTETAADSARSAEPIRTAGEALTRALEYTGFDKLRTFRIAASADDMAQRTTMTDSTTPFLSEYINGRSGWRIEFPGVVLDLDRASPEYEAQYPKNVVVFIDSSSGQLLEIRATAEGLGAEDLPAEATAEEAERQLRGMASEFYSGFPADPPSMTFVDALNKKIAGSILRAKLIVAQYLLYSRDNASWKPAWVIHLHGIPAYARDYVTQMRTVIDAQTGKSITAANVPHPPSDSLKLDKDSR